MNATILVRVILCAFISVVAVLPAAQSRAASLPPKAGELQLTRFYTKPNKSFDLFKIGGSLEFTNYSYFYSVPQTDIRTSNRLIFKLYNDMRIDEHVRLYAELKLTTDLPQSTVRTRVIPNEAYLDVAVDPVAIRAGYQIFSWGVADIYNPTDTLNPWDFTDIFDFEKEGIPALKVTYTRENFTLEGIWMPIPEESELPYRDSRFVQPFLTSVDNPLFPVIGLPPAIFDATENVLSPATSIENSQFGARVLGTIGPVDLGLSYFNGFEKVPHQETIIGDPDPATGTIPLTVNQIYLRKQIIGLNIAGGYKGLNLKSESALVLPYHTTHDVGGADRNHFIYTVGADYTFFDIADKQDFTIIVEFADQINFEESIREDFANPFQKTLFSRLEYRIADYLRLWFTSIYNFDSNSYYLNPEILWEVVDDLELKLGGNILDGSPNSLFGLFNKQDRVYASVKFYF